MSGFSIFPPFLIRINKKRSILVLLGHFYFVKTGHSHFGMTIFLGVLSYQNKNVWFLGPETSISLRASFSDSRWPTKVALPEVFLLGGSREQGIVILRDIMIFCFFGIGLEPPTASG